MKEEDMPRMSERIDDSSPSPCSVCGDCFTACEKDAQIERAKRAASHQSRSEALLADLGRMARRWSGGCGRSECGLSDEDWANRRAAGRVKVCIKELEDFIAAKRSETEVALSALLETMDWMRGRIEAYEETLNKDAYLLRRAEMQMETMQEVLAGMREREAEFDGKFNAGGDAHGNR
jgi:hypothetical protein